MEAPNLHELLDLPRLNTLMGLLHDATGIPVALLTPGGEIAVATGWQDVCTKFHRVHPVTCARCHESDAYINQHLGDQECLAYRCRNGLWDAAVPILVAGTHVGTLFVGQFRMTGEELDHALIERQAAECGFDAEAYRAAWQRTPVFSQDQLDRVLQCCRGFVGFLAESGQTRMRLTHDLRWRREIERQLHSNLQFVEALLSAIPNPIYSKDVNGVFQSCNVAFSEHILGLPRQQILGKTLFELDAAVSPDFALLCAQQDLNLISEPGVQQFEATVVCADGVPREFLFNTATCNDADGKVFAIVGVMIDMSDQRHVERRLREQARVLRDTNEALQAAHQAAEEASRAKNAFISTISHEIRTPMTAILGYVELVRDMVGAPADYDPQAIHEQLDVVTRNGQHLLQLINDLLDVSKMESGRLDVERLACEPGAIVRDVETLMRVAAEAKELELRIHLEGPQPKRIYTDPMRLRQILVNLIGNAIKFTAVGTVTLVVRLVLEHGKPLLEFTVEDTGIGMSSAELARLFQPFGQADASITRRFGGTGLGLTISKQLANLLGGDITATSQPGVGSRFVVTVATGPLEAAAFARVPQAVSSPVAKQERLNCRVLLADDGLDNQRLFRVFLEKSGAAVDVVDNGAAAVEAALGAESRNTPYDVIFMDMQMPVMDGCTATRKLRAAGYARPIIALTAHAMTGKRQECVEAGCTDYVTKPTSRQTLIAAVQRNLDAVNGLKVTSAAVTSETLDAHVREDNG